MFPLYLLHAHYIQTHNLVRSAHILAISWCSFYIRKFNQWDKWLLPVTFIECESRSQSYTNEHIGQINVTTVNSHYLFLDETFCVFSYQLNNHFFCGLLLLLSNRRHIYLILLKIKILSFFVCVWFWGVLIAPCRCYEIEIRHWHTDSGNPIMCTTCSLAHRYTIKTGNHIKQKKNMT